jgi:PTS system D-glucosamine-specific IIC component
MSVTGYFQRLGRAMMLPLTVLPAAAVFLMLSRLPWHLAGWPMVPELLQAAGMAVFQYAPYLFAVGIALGLSDQSVYAGMSALAGMFIYMLVTLTYDPQGVQPSMFAAVVIGILSGWAYERFKTLKLPEYLQFFGGSRFVPILMSGVSLAFAWLMIAAGECVRQWIGATGDIG